MGVRAALLWGWAMAALLAEVRPSQANAAELKCMRGASEEVALRSIREASLTYYNAEPAGLDAAQISFLLGLSSSFEPCQISIGQAQLNGAAGLLLKGLTSNGSLTEAFCPEGRLESCRIRASTPANPAAQAAWKPGQIARRPVGTDGYLYKVLPSQAAQPQLSFYGPAIEPTP